MLLQSKHGIELLLPDIISSAPSNPHSGFNKEWSLITDWVLWKLLQNNIDAFHATNAILHFSQTSCELILITVAIASDRILTSVSISRLKTKVLRCLRQDGTWKARLGNCVSEMLPENSGSAGERTQISHHKHWDIIMYIYVFHQMYSKRKSKVASHQKSN